MNGAFLAGAVLCAACGGQATSPPQMVVSDRKPIDVVLDDFHQAAAVADEARYFGHFAAAGVFLGTDGTERWDVAAFRAYAHPHFAAGKGWTYRSSQRHVDFAADGRTAWFDERLENEKYGALRGSGVVVFEAGEWRVAQYNLTFLVLNDRAGAVVELLTGRKPD